MVFNYSLDYTFRRDHANQDGLQINGKHQLLAYADSVNILGGSIHTQKENTESLVAATRKIGLDASADGSKYMVMSRDQIAGRNQCVRTDNNNFQSMEGFE